MSPRRLLLAAMLVGTAVLAHDGMVRLHAALFVLSDAERAAAQPWFSSVAPP